MLRTVLCNITLRDDPCRNPGGTPYNPYGKAPPKRGSFSSLQVYEREGISIVEVYERMCENLSLGSLNYGPQRANRRILWW